MQRLLIAALLLLVVTGMHAAEPDSNSDSPTLTSTTRLADPAIWGVYAYLVGGEWKKLTLSRSFEWGEDEEIVLTGKALAAKAVQLIRPAGPSRLEMVLMERPTDRWSGHITSDGSVIWTSMRNSDFTYRHSLRDGVFIEESVKLRNDEVVSTWDVWKFKRKPKAVSPSEILTSTKPIVSQDLSNQMHSESDPSPLTNGSSDVPASGDPLWPRFPDLPDTPEFAPFMQAKKLYEELTRNNWRPVVRAKGPGMVIRSNGDHVRRIKGDAFCAGRKGPVEVQYEPVKGAKLELITFRGREADCHGKSSGMTRGIYRFSDGRILIGDISFSRNNLRVRMTGTGIHWNDDDICLSAIDKDFRLNSLGCWNSSVNIFATAFDKPLYSEQPVRGRLIFSTLGYIDGQFQRGEFKTPREAVFIASDDSMRVTGQLMPATTLPHGAVLRAGETAHEDRARFFFTGLMRFETKIRTEFGGPGAYLYYGAVEPGAFPANVRPEPATLAKYTSLAEGCLLKPQLPVGWLPWGPNCDHAPDRLDAWSINGQLRIQYSLDEVRLQEFDPQRPGVVVSEWRANTFSVDPVLSILGTGELWRDGRMIYRGEFAGLAPQGEGRCTVLGTDLLEPCTYNAGERVDALYLARREQIKLDEEREAIRRQAEADERAREAAVRAEAARRAAAQQAREGGFQWGKFTALTVGAIAGGAGELDAASQADLLMGVITDSLSGNDGLSHTTAAMDNASLNGAPSSSSYRSTSLTNLRVPTIPDQNGLSTTSTANCNDYPIKYFAPAESFDSRADAEDKARQRAANSCGGTKGGIATLDISCSSYQPEYAEISSKGKVTKLPPGPLRWGCHAHGVCKATIRACDSSPGASRQ